MAAELPHTHPHADYGLDAPGIVRGLVVGGGLLFAAGVWLKFLGGPITGLANLGLWPGGSMLLTGLLMVASSRVGKHSAARRLLDGLELRGAERVLDVGCGRGLLLVNAAKRLPDGRAVGLDLWSQRDLSHNRRDATLENAEAEGVAERVEVFDGDMREMPFEDASFDAVVSSLAIHNVPGVDERKKALREIARVLKPGGRVALQDIAHVGEYASALREAGLTDVTVLGPSLRIFPPVRIVTGRR